MKARRILFHHKVPSALCDICDMGEEIELAASFG